MYHFGKHTRTNCGDSNILIVSKSCYDPRDTSPQNDIISEFTCSPLLSLLFCEQILWQHPNVSLYEFYLPCVWPRIDGKFLNTHLFDCCLLPFFLRSIWRSLWRWRSRWTFGNRFTFFGFRALLPLNETHRCVLPPKRCKFCFHETCLPICLTFNLFVDFASCCDQFEHFKFPIPKHLKRFDFITNTFTIVIFIYLCLFLKKNNKNTYHFKTNQPMEI